jgi:acetylornithine deacetylase/succinyl-diaminopimelate desuccinylase-like protein
MPRNEKEVFNMTASARHQPAIYQRPVELLQQLIRFNTTNPPGNEAQCIAYIRQLFAEAGFRTTLLAKDSNRPNLITRLEGKGDAPPLLMYGHVDVVTTEKQPWSQPPFEGKIVDGYIWGRGALDMKGGVAMMAAALLRAKAEGLVPAGDVIFAALSDEEAGGDFGASFLVEEHAELFRNVRYALGEFGGFTMYLGKHRFYPIQVTEKQMCWMKATLRGPGGHGSQPLRGGAMARLARMLGDLDRRRLPVHVTPEVRQMILALSAPLSLPQRIILRQLLNPLLTDMLLNILGQAGKTFEPLLRNTVNATILRASEKVNVIPSIVEVELDGRLLPGFSPEDLIAELGALVREKVEWEIVRYDPGPPRVDYGLFDVLAKVLVEMDPGSHPVPMVIPAVTDGRHFARLGVQTYGFIPMKLPPDFQFSQVVHAANERIPVEALTFGTQAIFRVLERYPG